MHVLLCLFGSTEAASGRGQTCTASQVVCLTLRTQHATETLRKSSHITILETSSRINDTARTSELPGTSGSVSSVSITQNTTIEPFAAMNVTETLSFLIPELASTLTSALASASISTLTNSAESPTNPSIPAEPKGALKSSLAAGVQLASFLGQ